MWYKQLVYYCFLVLLPVLFCVSCVSKADYETLQKENESLKVEVKQLQKELNLYKETFGDIHDGIEIPYYRMDEFGKKILPMGVINNLNAVNPTWGQLIVFLGEDRTERIRYWEKPGFPPMSDGKPCECEGDCNYGMFVCSDFAIRLHDNAEAKGIRAAVVIVSLEGKDEPHALNAFMTTDRGLVYIDCSGDEVCEGMDKVEYIKMGNDIGAIELWDGIGFSMKSSGNVDFPLDYEWFAGQLSLYKEYDREVEEFIAEIEKVSYQRGDARLFSDPSDVTKFEAWRERIKEMEENLITISEPQGGGIVTDVEIYW